MTEIHETQYDVEEEIESIKYTWFANIEFIDKSHRCTIECKQNQRIICISETYNMYSCLDSGLIHLCNINEQCNLCITNDDGCYVCLYSGRISESVLDYRERYKSDSHYTEKPDLGVMWSADDQDLTFHYELQMHKPKERKQIKENSSQFIIREERNKERQRLKDKQEKIKTIKEVINVFLYSHEIRKNINVESLDEFLRDHKRLLSKMIHQGQLPNLTELDAKFDEFVQSDEIFKIAEKNPEEEQKIQRVVFDLWNYLYRIGNQNQRKKTKIHFKKHTIGVLRLMSVGLKLRDYEIPKSTFVQKYILTTKQIIHYGNRFGPLTECDSIDSIKQIKSLAF